MEIVDVAAREAMLFAAAGLFVGGIDDLMVDACFIGRWLVRRLAGRGGSGRMMLDRLPAPPEPARLAIFVPAWDEAGVIGAMLGAALARLDHPNYRIYVGLYPNDPATADAAAAVAERDRRVRLVIGGRPGPTTKADNLNVLWRALARDDAAEGRRTVAVVLHDAEDVMHPAELRVFDALLAAHDAIQLPVLPLVKRGAALVSGHYADEFAEAHGKALVVRTALGAGMPLAGTGCAIAVAMLERVAAARGGDPFDALSLVEDYELGLRLAELGGRGVFARVVDGREVVAVRSLFPGTLGASVRQKARWMTGIALAGWDRTGWSRALAIGDHWFRLRDRRAPLAVLVLAAAYLAMMLWGLSLLLHGMAGTPEPAVGALTGALIAANAVLLVWRLAARMAFTARTYGPVEALWAVPRFLIGNYVALAAAPRALGRYWRLLGGATPVWDKTRHDFPDLSREGVDLTRPVFIDGAR